MLLLSSDKSSYIIADTHIVDRSILLIVVRISTSVSFFPEHVILPVTPLIYRHINISLPPLRLIIVLRHLRNPLLRQLVESHHVRRAEVVVEQVQIAYPLRQRLLLVVA